MDALLPASFLALVKASGAMLAVTTAVVMSSYWESLHVGSDGVYLI